MKVTTEELERCEVLMTVEIEPDQQQNLLKKAAQRISREVKIPGFRPGKAPFNVVVRRFGIEALQSEALEHSVENMIKESMTQVNLVPYAQIQLDGVEWEPTLQIKVRVPTRPMIELGDYREIRLVAKTVEVTDQDIEDALKRLQEQNATWAPVERPSEMGDLISMTVTEKDGETVLAEREAVEYELKPVDEEEAEAETEDEAEAEGDDEVEEGETAPKKSIRPDLTTPLLGLSAGDSKTFTVTYPEDFANEQYAGKDITFSVEVSAVKAKELDPLDDEFAQQVGDFETLDALKEKIREDIKQSRERMNDFELGSEVLDKVIENAEKLEWPLALEEEQIDHEVEHYEHHLKQAGLTLDSALRVQNKTKDQLREETRENVVKQLQRGLVMSKLAELEQLQVSQIEILQQAKLMADMYGGGSDQIWQNILASEARQNTIANDLLSNKVIERLAAIAKGEAPEPGAEEKPEETVSEASEAGSTSETVNETSQTESASEPSQPNAEIEPDQQPQDNEAAAAIESEDNVEDESTEEPITTEV